MPQRIRLQRTKGWRKPEGAVNVARPTRYGNPFDADTLVHYGPKHEERFGRAWDYEGRISSHGARHDMWFAADDVVETYVRRASVAERVELYRLTLLDPTPGMLLAYPSRNGHFLMHVGKIRAALASRDLACWCPLDQPCHADVLLELANEQEVA